MFTISQFVFQGIFNSIVTGYKSGGMEGLPYLLL